VAHAEEANAQEENVKPRRITVALSSVKNVPETVPATEDKPSDNDI